MCGILGVIASHASGGVLPDPKVCRAALASLHHRGPDANGQFRDNNVWLAHTRLSIIDPTPIGNQPMVTDDGRYVLSYNGETYNFKDLAETFGIKYLRSKSDTEIVLRAFAMFGVQALDKLNGMFAFAIYDKVAGKVWLVRDRFGIKPLYYQIAANRLMFSSEIKGILTLDSQARTCDHAGLHEWLYYGNPLGDRTLYRGIKQLLPGNYLEFDIESLKYQVSKYWSLRSNGDHVTRPNTGESVVRKTRELLEQAVKRQLVSDVPVGVFLSGGIDSSAIVAFASRHYDRRLATFSASFDFQDNEEELSRARLVASQFGTDHNEIYIEGTAVGSLVEKLVYHHDMPFADAANIPLYLMAESTHQDVKVVLQGDGGDEVFGGYRRYSTLTYYRALHAMARITRTFHRMGGKAPKSQRILRYLRAMAADQLYQTMALLLTLEDPEATPTAVFSGDIRRRIETTDPFMRYRDCQRMFDGCDIRNQMSMVDLMNVLPNSYLEKVDRATMAKSLEVRVPFLDHDLVEFVTALPAREKLSWGRKKWLLKRALDGIVPTEILYGPKSGLTVPFGHWLQNDLRSMFFDYLSTFMRNCPDVLDDNYVRHIFARTKSGKENHSYMLWKIFNLMIWVNNTNVRIVQ